MGFLLLQTTLEQVWSAGVTEWILRQNKSVFVWKNCKYTPQLLWINWNRRKWRNEPDNFSNMMNSLTPLAETCVLLWFAYNSPCARVRDGLGYVNYISLICGHMITFDYCCLDTWGGSFYPHAWLNDKVTLAFCSPMKQTSGFVC